MSVNVRFDVDMKGQATILSAISRWIYNRCGLAELYLDL